MTRDQWSRVKRLVPEAKKLPPESRHEWLAHVAADDAEVREEVESLLRADDRAGTFVDDVLARDVADRFEMSEDAPVPPRSRDALQLGVRINEYEIRREMRHIGMSAVYLAQDVTLGRLAVLKTVPSTGANDQSLLERLRQEARAAAAISHPSVAIVYEFVESPHGNFIASEYIQGRTLREEMTRGVVEPGRAVRLSIEIAQALCAAHDAHVIHRDLKPENLMVTPSGGIKIIDFGIARIDNPDGGTHPTFPAHGTVGYMAPEQAVAELRVDHRADLYALGTILAEMVLGCHPFVGGTGGMPERLRAIADRCLQPNRERRYQSARDLLHDLENVSHPLPPPAGTFPTDRRMFWWQFHQGSAALIYWLAAIPEWYARELIGGATGRALFYLTLAALIPAAILRLHLWFTSRTDSADLPGQLRRERPWIAGADALFVISLTVSGLLVGEARMSLATWLICMGLGAGIVAFFIEPASTRGALSSCRSPSL